MPQLDQFTYLTQFVWLCFFFMTFYVFLYKDGLPKISRILKLRAHLVSQQTGESSLSNKDVESSIVLQTALKSSLSYLYSSVSHASKWCSGMITSLNANQLKPLNKSYLRSLGEISVSQVIKNTALEASAPIAFTSGSKISNLKNLNGIYTLRVQRSLLSNIKTKKKKK